MRNKHSRETWQTCESLVLRSQRFTRPTSFLLVRWLNHRHRPVLWNAQCRFLKAARRSRDPTSFKGVSAEQLTYILHSNVREKNPHQHWHEVRLCYDFIFLTSCCWNHRVRQIHMRSSCSSARFKWTAHLEPLNAPLLRNDQVKQYHRCCAGVDALGWTYVFFLIKSLTLIRKVAARVLMRCWGNILASLHCLLAKFQFTLLTQK